ALTRPLPRPALFPYTTLFRSRGRRTLPTAQARGARKGSLPSSALPVGHFFGAEPLVALVGVPAAIFFVESSDHALGMRRVDAPKDRKSTRLNSSHVKISYAVF